MMKFICITQVCYLIAVSGDDAYRINMNVNMINNNIHMTRVLFIVPLQGLIKDYGYNSLPEILSI